MAVLIVYGDESADQKREQVFTIAGLIGQQADWDALEVEWVDRTGGIPFHAAECEACAGDFAPREGETRQMALKRNLKLYKDLTQIIARSNLCGYSHTMDLAAERAAFGEGELPDDSRYYWLFSRVVADCARFGYLCVPREQVKFSFDSRLESNYSAGKWYDYMAKLEEWKYHSFLSEHPVEFPTRKTVGIQVADLFAREAMKQFQNALSLSPRIPRASFRALNGTNRFKFNCFTGEYFKELKGSLVGLEQDPAFPMKRAAYIEWLNSHRLTDNMPNRLRYGVYVATTARLNVESE